MNRPATSYTRCYCGKDDCETKKDPLYANSEVDCRGSQDRKDMWFTIRFFIVVSILIWALFGCSAGGGSDEYGATYSYETDQYSDTGLVLKANTGNNYSFISFEQMVAEYIDLERCMVNTNTPGPTIIFQSFDHIGQTGTAFYVYVSQTAYINTDYKEYLPERNAISDREFLRHEYGHHVLYMNGLDDTHNNPLFQDCSALGPKTCNGEYCD